MTDLIQTIFGAIVITLADIYVWGKLLNKNIKLNNSKNIIIVVFMGLIMVLNYFYNNEFLRIVAITIIMSIFFTLLYSEKIYKSILGAVMSQLIFMVSEFIFVCILVYILKINPNNFMTIIAGKFLTNLIISLIAMFLVQFKFINKFYNVLVKITEKIKTKVLITFLFLLMIAANVYAGVMYYSFNFMYIMVFNVSLTIVCFMIIVNSFKTKNKYIKVYDKYNTTLNSLKEYEDMLDKYRVSNHENKNQLLTIRNMVPKTNRKVISYIDQIVENKLKDSEKIMLEVSKIPAGGLRGLIYSKLLLMNESKISYDLNISKDLKTVDLININESLMLDICKIIGVYIDNAIQEVKKLNKKYILMELYMYNEQLVIRIANNYKGIIEIDKIESKGYTTKGENHGYGLTLAKQIIDNNSKLSNTKEINKDLFTQILKIKL